MKQIFLLMVLVFAILGVTNFFRTSVTPSWATRKATETEISSAAISSNSGPTEVRIRLKTSNELKDYEVEDFYIATNCPEDFVVINTYNESHSGAGVSIYFLKKHEILLTYQNIPCKPFPAQEGTTIPIIYTQGGELRNVDGLEITGKGIFVAIH